MKPATYQETVGIVKAWCAGRIKEYLTTHPLSYDCCKMRVSRFRHAYPDVYKRLSKMLPFVTSQKGKRVLN